MVSNPNNTCVPEFLWVDGKEPPVSVGRSNCTLFLDHPELLQGWELRSINLPSDIEFPAFLRRRSKVRL